MKVYIAGKITGGENHKQKFKRAENQILEGGDIPLNPAELPEGLSPADYMKICFAMIDCADVVWFLDDFRDSKGATLEYMHCQYTSKQTAYGDKFMLPKYEQANCIRK